METTRGVSFICHFDRQSGIDFYVAFMLGRVKRKIMLSRVVIIISYISKYMPKQKLVGKNVSHAIYSLPFFIPKDIYSSNKKLPLLLW